MPKPSAVRKASGRIVEDPPRPGGVEELPGIGKGQQFFDRLEGGRHQHDPPRCVFLQRNRGGHPAGLRQFHPVMDGDLTFREPGQKKTGVEPPGLDLRGDPMGIGDQKIGGEEEPFPPDELRKGESLLVEFQTIGGESGGRFRSGQIDHVPAGVPGKKHPRLLEGLPDRGDKETEGGRLRKVLFLDQTLRIGRAETADAGRKFRVRIGVVQAASGKHVGPAHEGLTPAAPHQEDLIGPACPVAEQDDR